MVSLLFFLSQNPQVHPTVGEKVRCATGSPTPVHTALPTNVPHIFTHCRAYNCSPHLYTLPCLQLFPHRYTLPCLQLFPTPVHTAVHTTVSTPVHTAVHTTVPHTYTHYRAYKRSVIIHSGSCITTAGISIMEFVMSGNYNS